MYIMGGREFVLVAPIYRGEFILSCVDLEVGGGEEDHRLEAYQLMEEMD